MVEASIVEEDLSGLRVQKMGTAAQQGGLARAVGSDQADDLPRLEGRVDPLEDRAAVVADFEAVDAQAAHCRALRVRTSSNRKNGAPIRAVRTPILSSTPVGSSRTAMSVTSSRIAPPSVLSGTSRPGS